MNLIEKYWNKYPDMRFGQMLINIGLVPDDLMLWNIEDDEIESGLKSLK